MVHYSWKEIFLNFSDPQRGLNKAACSHLYCLYWCRTRSRKILHKWLQGPHYVDDTCKMTHWFLDIQGKKQDLDHAAQRYEPAINVSKMKTMRVNPRNEEPLPIQDQILKEMETFSYLRSIVETGGVRAPLWLRNVEGDSEHLITFVTSCNRCLPLSWEFGDQKTLPM